MFDRLSSEYRLAHGWQVEPEARPMFGPKYARLVQGSCCIGFVDLTNGDILYAAGWSGPGAGPAKRVRGNIWAEDFGLSALRWHGVARADEMPRKP